MAGGAGAITLMTVAAGRGNAVVVVWLTMAVCVDFTLCKSTMGLFMGVSLAGVIGALMTVVVSPNSCGSRMYIPTISIAQILNSNSVIKIRIRSLVIRTTIV